MTKVILASSTGAKLDSNVWTGGGTDDTAILQQTLDLAFVYGGIHLILDGAALVRGLVLHSNTTIECLNKDCGLFLADGTNGAILTNDNWNFETIQNRNIQIRGGTFNHNCKKQVHHVPNAEVQHPLAFGTDKWVIAFEFYGVDDLVIRDVTMRNQRTFTMLVANWKNVVMENINIDLPDHEDCQNQDGLHFWGPGQFLTLKNIRGRSGDDFIALAPDENDGVSSITDVEIDGVFLDHADQGIRMLSRGTGTLDRVTVKNVTGTYRSFGFFINPWFPSETFGHFGNISFENIDLRQEEPNYKYYSPFLFQIGGNVECISFKNIFHHNPTDNRTLFDIGVPFYTQDYDSNGKKPRFQTFLLDGLTIIENGTITGDTEYIQVRTEVENIIIRNVEIIRENRTDASGCLLKLEKNGKINRLKLDGITAKSLDSLLDVEKGEIVLLQESDIFSQNMKSGMIKNPNHKIKNTIANAVVAL